MTNPSDLAKQTPWDFACQWYRAEDIHRTINLPFTQRTENVPHDVYSLEFAEWLALQYQLAMRKGIEIGRKWDEWQSPPP